ncbi:hypothetical protein Dimus_022675 [Dionaea muscipula]
MRLASILGIPDNNGICEYIKEVWEESKYIKPLEITRKFANDDSITAARRVKSTEMKPFQRFLHFIVMKILVLRFGKRDTTSFMDLTYMDHILTKRLVNLPRLMMRHMAYVISVEYHELPYGDWLTMREQGVCWLEIGGIRRRDDEAEERESGSAEKFYDSEDEVQEAAEVVEEVSEVPAQASAQQKETTAARVDSSIPTGIIPDSVFMSLQAEFERARAKEFKWIWTRLKQRIPDF